MKKIFFALLLVSSLFGLDKMSTISSDNKKILNNILDRLDLKSLSVKDQNKIYEKIDFMLERDWYTTFMDNNTAAKTKVSDANTKFLEMTIVDENRIYYVTFINFKLKKQVFVITRQTIPSDSDSLLKKFKEIKENKNYELLVEKDSYGYLREKGYMSDTVIQIPGKEGLISYVDMSTIEF